MKKSLPWIIVLVILLVLLPTIISKIMDLVNPIKITSDKLAELSKANKALLIERDSINTALQQAQTDNVVKKKDLQKALDRADLLVGKEFNLKAIIDSLGEKLRSVKTGTDTVIIREAGKIVDNQYEDDWIKIKLQGVSDSLSYSFRFQLSDVSVTTEDDYGNQRTIYSVWLESLVNSKAKMFLGDYRVESVTLKDKVKMFDWTDTRLLFGAQLLDTRVSLGLSFCSLNLGLDKTEGNVLLRFPAVLLNSNTKDLHSISGAIALNVGYFAPLIENAYLFTGYGVCTQNKSGIVFGVLVTL